MRLEHPRRNAEFHHAQPRRLNRHERRKWGFPVFTGAGRGLNVGYCYLGGRAETLGVSIAFRRRAALARPQKPLAARCQQAHFCYTYF